MGFTSQIGDYTHCLGPLAVHTLNFAPLAARRPSSCGAAAAVTPSCEW
jgi:hypothetical protein